MHATVRGSLPNRSRWVAIAAGLVFLLAAPAAERLAAATGADPALALGPGEDPQGRLEAIFLRANPRLGSGTSRRIADAVMRCGENQGLDPDLVVAVILVESSARPHVRSPKGAIGLMQVMPHMFRVLRLPGNVAHLEANIEAGCLLLADNIRRLGEADGISAYFWGRRIHGDGYLRRVQAVLEELALREEPLPRRRRG
jgi:soluble lytic murein transglycosylase-like protein